MIMWGHRSFFVQNTLVFDKNKNNFQNNLTSQSPRKYCYFREFKKDQ